MIHSETDSYIRLQNIDDIHVYLIIVARDSLILAQYNQLCSCLCLIHYLLLRFNLNVVHQYYI